MSRKLSRYGFLCHVHPRERATGEIPPADASHLCPEAPLYEIRPPRPREGLALPVSRYYWSDQDIATLVQLVAQQLPTWRIAEELERTPQAIRLKASRMGVALTAHEARRSARRAAKMGQPDAARAPSTPRRRRLVITADFDLSSLTRDERLALAERLREMEAREETSAEGGESPSAPLQLPKRYDARAVALARAEAQRQIRAANHAALGWKTGKAGESEEEKRPSRRQLRRMKRAELLAKQDDGSAPPGTR